MCEDMTFAVEWDVKLYQSGPLMDALNYTFPGKIMLYHVY